jgi:hypothetical protein
VLVWPLAQSGDRRDVHLILAAKIRVSPVFSQVSPEFPDPQVSADPRRKTSELGKGGWPTHSNATLNHI